MKLLTITAEYPPFFVGGITLHVHELNTLLANRGFEPWVITFQPNSDKQDISLSYEDNVHVVRIPIPIMLENASYQERYIEQNKKIREGIDWLSDHNFLFDLLVLHGYFLADVAIYAKSHLQIPLVYHVHTLYSINQEKDSHVDTIQKAEKNICVTADKIISVSEYLKNLIASTFNDIDYNKINIVNKAIHLKDYDQVETSRSKDLLSKKIIYVGRISPEKGIEVLLYALKTIKSTWGNNFLLYIIGQASDVSYLYRLKEIILELDLIKNVVFNGYMNKSQIIEEYKSSDVAIVPSYSETFGKVAIEAMAAKVPVIVSDVGGLGPIVDPGITGYRFSVGDSDDLAKKILLLLKNEELASRIKEAAYTEVKKKYQWGHILQQTIDIYREVINCENLCSSSASG